MGSSHFLIILLLSFLVLLCPSSSLPLCTDSRAPLPQKTPLTFCPYNGTSPSSVRNVINFQQISLVLVLLLDNFLYCATPQPQQIPRSLANLRMTSCAKVCDHMSKRVHCEFSLAASLKGQAPTPVKSNFTMLTDLWQSQGDFCNAFGGASGDGSVCFAGEPVALNTTEPPSPPGGLCLEKIGNGSYLNMAAHPDGSKRAFFSNQQGKYGWLPFQKLTLKEWPLLLLAQLRISNHGPDVQEDALHPAFEVKAARPNEVRRIFTMGLPFTSHHGGQILFGPRDGYLYFMMGDGGGTGDAYNFAQNKKSLLGKIMRLDVDSTPSAAEITKLGLWGNYTIPKDNPYIEDKELQPEIWALGMRNPWRCSFDSARPSYFMCADVGQDHYEEVDIITKGGNYGWRIYEGARLFTPPKSPAENATMSSINPIFPVMGYNHSDVDKNEGSASITGGYFYRSTADPCMSGRYLYADLYARAM
ncbi:hypothetical protein HAX54_041462 [Datura stramonium]|uniref:Glucose/Sorbosone dehydrogenase domain-containing protein n=1 Tax=Datura stramonium TaxID=4076 RepID=A0ABS8SLJ3_DATST|nr:hypothetical protein [Datura stramonium]